MTQWGENIVIEFGTPRKLGLIKMCLINSIVKFEYVKICQMHFLFGMV